MAHVTNRRKHYTTIDENFYKSILDSDGHVHLLEDRIDKEGERYKGEVEEEIEKFYMSNAYDCLSSPITGCVI